MSNLNKEDSQIQAQMGYGNSDGARCWRTCLWPLAQTLGT